MISKCSITSRAKKKGTCFTKIELISLIRALNHNRKKKVIDFVQKNTKKQLWEKLRDVLGPEEHLWIKHPFIHNINSHSCLEKLSKFTFKPKGPKGQWSWLTDKQITDAMKQYEKYSNTNFYYAGTRSADYFQNNPKKLTFVKGLLKIGYRVGIIFNLDPQRLPGSHWVAVFLNGKGENDYFDSNGDPPNHHIKTFLRKIPGKTVINKTEYQKKDGSCGLFAMDFILNKVAYNEYIPPKNENEINNQRREFFI